MSVSCIKCDKQFSRQSNVNRHLRETHKVEEDIIKSYDINVHNFKCAECSSSFVKNNDLRQHLHDTHNLNNNLMELITFSSYKEFMNWLKCEEYDNGIEYNKSSSCCKNIFKTTYFNCNRSGKIIEKKVKLKRTKVNGSCKLNKYCTSQIIVRHDLVTGAIVAKYYYVHYGHNASIQHIRLPRLTKQMVAEKLLSGVPPSRILMEERKSVESEPLQRKDLLTRKDILNIKKAYKIHINASASVDNHLLDTQVDILDDDMSLNHDLPELTTSVFKQSEVTIEAKKQRIKKDLLAVINSLDNETLSNETIETIFQHVKIAKDILCVDENKIKCMPLKLTITKPDYNNCRTEQFIFNHNQEKADGNLQKNNEQKVIIEAIVHDHNY